MAEFVKHPWSVQRVMVESLHDPIAQCPTLFVGSVRVPGESGHPASPEVSPFKHLWEKTHTCHVLKNLLCSRKVLSFWKTCTT